LVGGTDGAEEHKIAMKRPIWLPLFELAVDVQSAEAEAWIQLVDVGVREGLLRVRAEKMYQASYKGLGDPVLFPEEEAGGVIFLGCRSDGAWLKENERLTFYSFDALPDREVQKEYPSFTPDCDDWYTYELGTIADSLKEGVFSIEKCMAGFEEFDGMEVNRKVIPISDWARGRLDWESQSLICIDETYRKFRHYTEIKIKRADLDKEGALPTRNSVPKNDPALKLFAVMYAFHFIEENGSETSFKAIADFVDDRMRSQFPRVERDRRWIVSAVAAARELFKARRDPQN
jgi:hypothetical protein